MYAWACGEEGCASARLKLSMSTHQSSSIVWMHLRSSLASHQGARGQWLRILEYRDTLVSGMVCALDRLAGRDVCALHGHGINPDGVRIRHRPHFLEQRDWFGLGGDGLYLHRRIAIGGTEGHKGGG